MILKSKCNRCLRKVAIEGENAAAAVVCPNCNGTIRLPRVILEQGEVLGDYTVNRHIGSGSMGDVYLATQITMDRDVAIKIIPPEISEDTEAIDSFLSEIRTLAKLDHPNIVTAFQAGEAGGHHFLAMSYQDGGSLEDLIQRDGPLSEADALRMVMRIAKALRYAWDRFQLIHRDIKPENIMLDSRSPEPKVLDLGISKVIGDDRNLHSEKRLLVGTPYYMSPEQAETADDLDFRTDIYSLGCTLFHMVTGHVPFEAEDPLAVLVRHRMDPIPNPHDFAEDLHPTTIELIQIMMAKRPEDRFESWAELMEAVKHCLRGLTESTRKLQPVSTLTSKLERPVAQVQTGTLRTDDLDNLDSDLFESRAPAQAHPEFEEEPEDAAKWIPILSAVLILLLVLIGGYVFYAQYRARALARELDGDADGKKDKSKKTAITQDKTEPVARPNPKTPDTGNEPSTDLKKLYFKLLGIVPKSIPEASELCRSIDELLPEIKKQSRAQTLKDKRARIAKMWSEKVMEELNQQARVARKQKRSLAAAVPVYLDYDGPFKTETEAERKRIANAINARISRGKRRR